MPPIHLITLSVTLTLWLSSCTVGPNYQQPANNLPANYKATGEASIPPVGDPYHLFRDPDLNRLLAASEKNNQDLVAALARIDQSRALLGLTKADRAPSLTADLGATRNLDSRETNMPIEGGAYGEFSSQLNLSYEIDLWGRIRRSVNQANANLKASEADYHAALLSLKGEVARNYLTLRSLDREIDLLEQTRDLRAKRRDLTRARKTGGTASGLDLSRAETELQSSRAEIARLRLRRGELENTLAALTGSPASTFNLTSRTTNPRLPNIPAGVPSDLLRRRPDLIASERRLAAASEGIGIAIATYLPRLTLTGTGGTRALNGADLFNPSSAFYQTGPALFAPLFQGGRQKSDKARAEAAFREALANYRQTLLLAIRDTENALLGNRRLDQTLAAQTKATSASENTARLTRARFEGGLDSLFEVTETERQTLEQERLLTQTQLNRQLATVNLIQALGGHPQPTK